MNPMFEAISRVGEIPVQCSDGKHCLSYNGVDYYFCMKSTDGIAIMPSDVIEGCFTVLCYRKDTGSYAVFQCPILRCMICAGFNDTEKEALRLCVKQFMDVLKESAEDGGEGICQL